MTANSNYLDRAYMMEVLHPAPRRVVVVGMSSGAWTRIISGFPEIETIDVVELNPAYEAVIRAYPQISPVLDDPRVEIHIDDGRRWLRAHPDQKYDLMFQNTTYHWRAYATLLLSREYMLEMKAHLNPGGILGINATGSLDVFRTAIDVFPYVVRYRSFVYMSERPLVRRPDAELVLRRSKIGNVPAFAADSFSGDGVAAHLLNAPIVSAAEFIKTSAREVDPEVITDLNLVPEFRHGEATPFRWVRPFLPPTPADE